MQNICIYEVKFHSKFYFEVSKISNQGMRVY